MADDFKPNKDGKGITFFSQSFNCDMAYMYPDSGHHLAGWILRKTKGGQWVTERKATDKDIAAINEAVVRQYHSN